MSGSKVVKKFFTVMLSASATKLPLPPDLTEFIDDHLLPQQEVRIGKCFGKYWDVILDKDGEIYYLKRGWPKLVQDLELINNTFLFFDFVGHSYWMIQTFLPNQDMQEGSSFYRIFKETKTSNLVLPSGFCKSFLINKLPNSTMHFNAGDDYNWELMLNKISDHYCLTNGWKEILHDIPLINMTLVLFQLNEDTNFKLTIYLPNGLQLLLPKKNDNEQLQEDIFQNDNNVEEYELVNETNESIAIKVSRTFRIPKPIVQAGQIDKKLKVKIKVNNFSVVELIVSVQKNRNNKRYVVRSWNAFIKEKGIKVGDKCILNFDKGKDILQISNFMS